MKAYFNKRNILLILATLLVLTFKWYTDPTAGALTAEFMLYGATPVMAVLAVHWLRKLLFPYVDMGELYDQARTSAVGQGLAFVGMALIIFGLLGLFGPSVRAQDVKTYIPAQAHNHLPTLAIEQAKYWDTIPKKHISLG